MNHHRPAQTLHLVLGPTSSAKTVRSVELAAAFETPVISVDRIQVFDDLATTSGRPTAAELNGTQRIYLDHRRLREAPVEPSAVECLGRLRRLTAELGSTVILEGGSMSLWQSFFAALNGQRIQPILRLVTNWDAHAAAIERRCVGLMTAAQPSMLDELAVALAHPAPSKVAVNLVGVEAVVDWCTRHHVAPRTLGAYRGDDHAVRSLAAAMRPAVMAHARRQQHAFRVLLASHPHQIEAVR